MPVKSFLTAAEIARRLGVNERRVQRLLKRDWDRRWDRGSLRAGYEPLFPHLIKWPHGHWWVPLEEVERVLGSAVAAAGCSNNEGMGARSSRTDAG